MLRCEGAPGPVPPYCLSGRTMTPPLQCAKTASVLAGSDEPPYGTSMPGAGAVHHIRTGPSPACLGLTVPMTLVAFSLKFALLVSKSILTCRKRYTVLDFINLAQRS